MRTAVVLLSLLAIAVGVGSILIALSTQPPLLGLRLIASVLLMDQGTLGFLSIKLPVQVRGLRLALGAGSALAIAAGALILVLCAMPHNGPPEIAMGVVGAVMIVHGAITLRWLQSPSRAESA